MIKIITATVSGELEDSEPIQGYNDMHIASLLYSANNYHIYKYIVVTIHLKH